MKNCAGVLSCLAALFILGGWWSGSLAAQSGEADLDPLYGSFDSFDPSADFENQSPAPLRARPVERAIDLEPVPDTSPAAAPLRGAADIPDPRLYDDPSPEPEFIAPEPQPAEEARPAIAEPVAEPEPAPAPAPAPVPRSTPPAAAPPPPPAPALTTAASVDYSRSENWLIRPESPDRSVDIFYVYPGLCGRAGSGGALCPAGDPSTRSKAEEATRFQAGVFEPVGNLYVPFYRQSNSTIFLGLGPEERESRILPSAADVAAAFDYYFKNYNKGRPFILAGHGQGSAAILKGILSDYFRANPEARARLVAAYVLGYGVTSDFLSTNEHLRFAERRDDLGVIISYTTEIPGLSAHNPVIQPRTVAINPINWSRSSRKGAAALSQGANLSPFGGDELVKDFADARVNLRRGVVECSTVDWDEKYGAEIFPDGAMPDGDYAFYYYDLRRNAQDRAEAFARTRGAVSP